MARIEPGRVVLRHRPPLRWALLGLALLLSCWAVLAARELGFAGGPRLAALLGALLTAGGLVALRHRLEIEIGPVRVMWRKRSGWAFRVTERAIPRADLLAVELGADVVLGRLQNEAIRRMQHDVVLRFAPRTAALPSRVRLASFHRERRARAFARDLCEGAGLPLLDCTGERPELRPAARLVGPPSERPAPSEEPAPRGIAVDQDPRHGEKLVLSSWTGRRTALWLADGAFVIARSWWLLPLGQRRVVVDTIERVRGQRGPREAVPNPSGRMSPVDPAGARVPPSRHLAPGVVIATARRAQRIGSWLSPSARQWVVAWIAARLWPDVPTVRAVGGTDGPPVGDGALSS